MTRGRDAGLYAGGLLFQQGIAFGVGVAAARWLGPQGYGQVSLARAIYGVAVILAPLGLDLSLLRRLGESGAGRAAKVAQVQKLRQITWAVNLAVVAAMALAGAPWLQAHLYRQPGFALDLVIAFTALPFAADLAVLTAACRALDRVAQASLASLYLQPVVRTVALGGLLALGLGARGVLAATAVGVAAANLVLAALLMRGRRPLRAEPPAPEPPGVAGSGSPARLFGYSGWMAAMLLTYGALKLVDVLVLGHFRPAREVGDYAAVSAIAQLICLYPTALSQTLGPTVAGLYAAGSRRGVRRELGRYLRLSSLACAPLLAGVAVFGPWLDLVFGARFRFDPWLCFALALGAYVSGVFGPMSVSLSMTGRHRPEFAILLTGALASLAGCLLLAPAYGGVGVAWATLGGYLLVNGVRTAVSAQVMGGLDVELGDVAAPVACLMLALVWRALAERFGAHDWPTALLTGAGLLASYTVLYGVALLSPGEVAQLLAFSRRRWRSAARAVPSRS
ncbi:lipopolysaccharide biosynthesis protein [Caulobacter sp. S45]|uniref:lipopolysaccharide biosynthesis protein n=1 Tax=Caulobacter sp. S45 TaxID=1641861 RepID=UPI001576569D|nr:oligosaccharide flippase family protein [Caulobacter sp. S45]